MYQFTPEIEQFFEEVFAENEYVERNIHGIKRTTKDREQYHLKELKENPDLELSPFFNLTSITGIKDQIRKLNEENNLDGKLFYLKKNREKDETGNIKITIEKFDLSQYLQTNPNSL